MKKNKYLDKFNKTTFFLSLLILVLLYILYIHNTNYNNLFENYSSIYNNFINPCDEGYPHFYTSKTPQVSSIDEISCNYLCDSDLACKFYTISGGNCNIFNSINDISVNCNGKENIITDISNYYKGIGFIKDVNDISYLNYHDDYLYNVNNVLNNKKSLNTQINDLLDHTFRRGGTTIGISTEILNEMSNNMLGLVPPEDIWNYMNISGVRYFDSLYNNYIEKSFNTYLDNMSKNRGNDPWSYTDAIGISEISSNYPNPKRMIKQKQNIKDIEQTNKDLEEYTKKKTQFVYMFLVILIILTGIMLTLYFIIPDIVTELILIIYFIGIFSILFYLKGYL